MSQCLCDQDKGKMWRRSSISILYRALSSMSVWVCVCVCVCVHTRVCVCICERDQQWYWAKQKNPAFPEEIFIYRITRIYIPKTKIKACVKPKGFLRTWLLFWDVRTIYLELHVDQLMSGPSHGPQHEMYPCHPLWGVGGNVHEWLRTGEVKGIMDNIQ